MILRDDPYSFYDYGNENLMTWDEQTAQNPSLYDLLGFGIKKFFNAFGSIPGGDEGIVEGSKQPLEASGTGAGTGGDYLSDEGWEKYLRQYYHDLMEGIEPHLWEEYPGYFGEGGVSGEGAYIPFGDSFTTASDTLAKLAGGLEWTKGFGAPLTEGELKGVDLASVLMNLIPTSTTAMYDPLGVGLSPALAKLLTGQSPYTITPGTTEKYFQESVKAPMLKAFREEILPEIKGDFMGPGTYWGSARIGAETKAASALADTLASKRAELAYKDEEARRAGLVKGAELQVAASQIASQLAQMGPDMMKNYSAALDALVEITGLPREVADEALDREMGWTLDVGNLSLEAAKGLGAFGMAEHDEAVRAQDVEYNDWLKALLPPAWWNVLQGQPVNYDEESPDGGNWYDPILEIAGEAGGTALDLYLLSVFGVI